MISVEDLWLEEKKSKISVVRCLLLVIRNKISQIKIIHFTNNKNAEHFISNNLYSQTNNKIKEKSIWI